MRIHPLFHFAVAAICALSAFTPPSIPWIDSINLLLAAVNVACGVYQWENR